MSVLDDFVAESKGQQLKDPAGGFKGECVSLWKDYFVWKKGVPFGDLFVPDGRAKNIWKLTTPALLKWFDKVPITQSPQPGDTVVYDGIDGDVALYIGNGQVFGQLGKPVYQLAAVRPIGNPLGYLRYKEEENMDFEDVKYTRLAALHRMPSEAEVKGDIGRKPSEAANAYTNSPEWQTQNEILLNAYPKALEQIKKLQAGESVTQAEIDDLVKKADDLEQSIKNVNK